MRPSYLTRTTLLAASMLALGGPALAQSSPPNPASSSDRDTQQKKPAGEPQPAGSPGESPASGDIKVERWAVHGQFTNIQQFFPRFHAPYQGAQSFQQGPDTKETTDATLYLGARLWPGAEGWFNFEAAQGIAPSNTLGAAGYVNGEGAKVGRKHPYSRVHRLFLRQTFDFGGERQKLEPDLNVLGGSQSEDRLVLTAGKFNSTDVFDANAYAHDPRGDFLNWSAIAAGTFDYAADAWGYTIGGAAELYVGRYTVRAGAFDLSIVPNSTRLDPHGEQFQLIGEVEERHKVFGRDGKLKLTGYVTRGRMGTYADALSLAAQTGVTADTGAVRRYRARTGLSLNLEQKLTDDLGAFARVGFATPTVEPYEYTDIDRTLSAGLSLAGKRWGRKDDTVGAALIANQISRIHQAYLAAGGLGILIGDGRLPHPGTEQIAEAYYNIRLRDWAHLSVDAQGLDNPAYNRDRGPILVLSARIHLQR